MRLPREAAHQECCLAGWCLKGAPNYEYIKEHSSICLAMGSQIENARIDGASMIACGILADTHGIGIEADRRLLEALGISEKLYLSKCEEILEKMSEGKSPSERLIPEGYVLANGWKIGETDETKGPMGEPTLILEREDGLRVTIGDLSSVFVAVRLGAFVK